VYVVFISTRKVKRQEKRMAEMKTTAALRYIINGEASEVAHQLLGESARKVEIGLRGDRA
jgi:hypothetical protein